MLQIVRPSSPPCQGFALPSLTNPSRNRPANSCAYWPATPIAATGARISQTSLFWRWRRYVTQEVSRWLRYRLAAPLRCAGPGRV